MFKNFSKKELKNSIEEAIDIFEKVDKAFKKVKTV